VIVRQEGGDYEVVWMDTAIYMEALQYGKIDGINICAVQLTGLNLKFDMMYDFILRDKFGMNPCRKVPGLFQVCECGERAWLTNGYSYS
jgi:hypothetical protein